MVLGIVTGALMALAGAGAGVLVGERRRRVVLGCSHSQTHVATAGKPLDGSADAAHAGRRRTHGH